MNREIKFRAWDFVEKEMQCWDEILEFIPMYDFFLDDGRYKPMQYTGLNDKNGKEIYEEDIIDLSSFTPNVMRIRFIEGAFCLCNLKGEYVADIYYISHGDENQALVIGNIYENPELMEVECE